MNRGARVVAVIGRVLRVLLGSRPDGTYYALVAFDVAAKEFSVASNVDAPSTQLLLERASQTMAQSRENVR